MTDLEVILVAVAAFAAVVGVIIQLVGDQRFRRWVRLEEPEPYMVADLALQEIDKDPRVAPLMKAESEAGNKTDWFQTHLAPVKLRDGYEYLRLGRAKIVYRSKTLAHGDELVLMVKRGR